MSDYEPPVEHAAAWTKAILEAQPRALRSVDRLIDEGRAHAFMLVGDPASGSRDFARYIAARVLCPAGGGDDCNVCGRAMRGVHPDVTWVRPEALALSANEIRGVIPIVSRRPFEADAQVIVIEDADSLSDLGAEEAGNSLLKVLEEPEGRVVFVLLVKNTIQILSTLRSRAIEIPLPPATDALLSRAIEAAGITAADLASAGLDNRMILRIARGNLDRAASIAVGGPAARRRGDVLAHAARLAGARERPAELAAVILDRAAEADADAVAATTVEFDALAQNMDPRELKTFQSKSADDGREKRTKRRARRARVRELAACLDELAWWYRDLLAVRAGATASVTNVDRLPALEQLAAAPASLHALLAIDAIEDARTRLLVNNADEPVMVAALCAELAGLAEGRVRARRALGPTASTATGYDLSLA